MVTPTFFRYWMGAEFGAVASPIAEILFLGAWINGLGFVAYSLLESQRRPDLNGKIHAIEVLPFLAVLWALMSAFGILGAAIAWTLRVAIDAFILFWLAKLPRRAAATLVLPAGALVVCVFIASLVGDNIRASLPIAAVAGGTLLAVGCAVAEELRRPLKAALRGTGLVAVLQRRPKSQPSS